jgi:hypothetical protein
MLEREGRRGGREKEKERRLTLRITPVAIVHVGRIKRCHRLCGMGSHADSPSPY